MSSPAARLRALLEARGLLVMPCCFDAWSARLVEAAGFPLTFMSGFAVAAARGALPDTGLLSYGEMLEQGREICSAVSIPVIGDARAPLGLDEALWRSAAFADAGADLVFLEAPESEEEMRRFCREAAVPTTPTTPSSRYGATGGPAVRSRSRR